MSAFSRVVRSILLFSLFLALPLLAQQTGALHGRVTATDGSALPGVTVEASANVLPTPRTTLTDSNGEYRMPQLIPGNYKLTFTLAGMQTVSRNVSVQLGQDIDIDAALGMAGVEETITVTAAASLVDKESTELQSGLGEQQIRELPVAQDYKDLQKLIPGVQVTNDDFRGPSAGASGQDNVYKFDGVNVTMPLFGILNAEPATHDIAQVTVVKGGAKAVDFNRAGGFLIDSVSKSGTNKFSGEVSYQLMNNGFIADQAGSTNSRYLEDRDWTTVSLGGPIIGDQLFFYGSYYRPTRERSNQANLYGDLPKYESTRNEEFGKLTWTPAQSWLINGSYRYSNRKDTSGDDFGTRNAGTTGNGSVTKFQVGTLEISDVINTRSYATAKFTDYRNPGIQTADHSVNGVTISTALGTHLDINNLDTLGRFTVPAPGSNAAANAFFQAYIDKYGYVQNGVRTGGGRVGFGPFLNDDDDFYRKSGQVGYNLTLGSATQHDLHAGYQRYEDSEDRFQTSNGWGDISIQGGATNCTAAVCGSVKPIFFTAFFSPQTTGAVPTIHSEFHSQAFEFNDTIRMNNWSFNVGVMASNDTLYGQGLAKANNLAGYTKSPGTKYKMFEVPWRKMIQPRLGATWAYNGSDTLYASYARYNPAANSDARAASWDRNLVGSINAYFDASGNLIGVDPVTSSSGKLFVPDIDPPQVNEYMLGTAQQINNHWSARLYGRYRRGDHFWEDVPNNSRVCYKVGPGATGGQCIATSVPSDAPGGVPRQPYIPDLPARLAAIGSGSSYVIAELDGAFTKYYEATAESEWNSGPMFIRGSYTWSHYYGNFDQDNTTVVNDAAAFIGSSFIGDGAGRQVWNNRYGDLRGDRRQLLKVMGTYTLPWRASAGAFFNYQSGQPYELWSFLPYNPELTTSSSDSSRFAEPAGRRHTPSHTNVDLNYTQNLPLPRGLNLQFVFDMFNLFDKQTGYNFENRVGTLGTCTAAGPGCLATEINDAPFVKTPFARSFYGPRRYQLGLRVQF
ncbi:MAG: TonB-dependent receptor [Acidobacteria bacterium]|nr:MAG: TonB-dependent receptor [Acidobacteriota bacterium]